MTAWDRLISWSPPTVPGTEAALHEPAALISRQSRTARASQVEIREHVIEEQQIDVVPARWVSPFVESTWNTPSSTRRIEMSNVPPPRS
jgi:hypothetical protein